MPESSDPIQTFDPASWAELAALLTSMRQAALATLAVGAPYTAMVAYAAEPGLRGFLVHLSDLSAHKAHLHLDPRASLLVCEPDDGQREILQHRRVSLACRAETLSRDTPEYTAAQAVYLARFPGHRVTFDLKDFDLVRLVPTRGLLNAGFGRAYRVTPADLDAAAATLGTG